MPGSGALPGGTAGRGRAPAGQRPALCVAAGRHDGSTPPVAARAASRRVLEPDGDELARPAGRPRTRPGPVPPARDRAAVSGRSAWGHADRISRVGEAAPAAAIFPRDAEMSSGGMPVESLGRRGPIPVAAFFSLTPTLFGMPRASVEAKAGAAWRAKAAAPSIQPPSYLCREGKSLWTQIITSKPSDWFDVGSLAILGKYCNTSARHDELVLRLTALEAQEPVNVKQRNAFRREASDLERRILEHAKAVGILGARLRLTVQNTIDRTSGMLDERYPSDDDDRLFAGRQLDS
jgi:hypothetical protein